MSRAEINDVIGGVKAIRYIATSKPSQYVYQSSRIRTDQKRYLADKNASKVIRDALDLYINQ